MFSSKEADEVKDLLALQGPIVIHTAAGKTRKGFPWAMSCAKPLFWSLHPWNMHLGRHRCPAFSKSSGGQSDSWASLSH